MTDFEESYSNMVLPSKPTAHGAVGGTSQKDRRFTDTFFDIHKSSRFPNGRPWTGEREYAANADLGHLPGFISDLQQGEHVANDAGVVDRTATFASVWEAPWVPTLKYFKFNYKRKLISFDYPRMLMEERAAYDRYYEAAAIYGAELNREVEYGVIPHFQITSKLGLPTKMVKIAEAAIAGDPWLLGFIDEPNTELAAILHFTPSGFRRRSYSPDVTPVVTPEQVLATPQHELLALVADMAAKAAAAAVDAAFARREREAAAKPKRSHHKRSTSATASAP